MCTDISTIVTGIYLIYKGVCYTNGAYFINGDLSTANPLMCGHSDVGGGQWLYPDGTTSCDSTGSPIQCTHNDNTIKLSKGTGSFDIDDHELGYKCCLPDSCSNSGTDMITANIYSKYM